MTTPPTTARTARRSRRAAGAALLTLGALSGCGSPAATSTPGDLGVCPDAGEVACCPGGCGSGAVCTWNESANPVCVKTCKRATDCSTGCCAPARDRSGDVVGPYACLATQICCAAGSCPGSQCCAADAVGNTFCARVCADDTACGAGHCHSEYTFPLGCGAQKACGP